MSSGAGTVLSLIPPLEVDSPSDMLTTLILNWLAYWATNSKPRQQRITA